MIETKITAKMKQRFKQSRVKIGQTKLLMATRAFHRISCERDWEATMRARWEWGKLEPLIQWLKNRTGFTYENLNHSTTQEESNREIEIKAEMAVVCELLKNRGSTPSGALLAQTMEWTKIVGARGKLKADRGTEIDCAGQKNVCWRNLLHGIWPRWNEIE
jgi:hypothetical protein